MPLKVGQQAPNFTLPSTNGGTFTLAEDLAGRPCVLFFYPKNFTPTCTQEACSFRDSMEDFAELEIDVIGVSKDDLDSHRKFKEENALPFDLLSDDNGEVCALYDALVPVLRMPKRVTYLLDSEHRIAGVVNNMFNAKAHVNELMAQLGNKK